MYVTVWQFTVPEHCVADFKDLYGREGAWVKLFAQAPTYLGTELLQAEDDERRFLTIDRWTTQEAYEAFRAEKADEYAAIDALGEGLTLDEAHVGSFEADE